MSSLDKNSQRVARNTIALFIRMLVIMLISLYTSRVVLRNLGVIDFGIYNVVGGFVAMFSIISNSISGSISRYLTYSLGKGDIKMLAKIFATSINILYLVCVLLLIVMESFGLWFLNYKMAIPESRLYAANWVFQISILTLFIDIISMPYNALIVAYERMTVFAYIGIVEAVGKLVVAILIAYSPIDVIIYYSLLMAVVAIVIRFLYSVYCRYNFKESKYRFVIDLPLIKEMFNFAGWNFFGVSSSMLADQGVNIILNVFFGPVVNTARGLAIQVNTAVTGFSNNFMTALNPQITKSYASKNQRQYINIVCKGAKFSYFLIYLFALSVILTTPFLLHFWLGNIPEYTITFVRLILLNALFSTLSNPLVTLLLATGEIRVYQLLVGGLRFIVLPVDYFVLTLGFPPESVFLVTIFIEIVCMQLRLYRLKFQIGFPIKIFWEEVILKVGLVSLVSGILSWFAQRVVVGSQIYIFSQTVLVCLLLSVICIYFMGLTEGEKSFFNVKIKSCLNRLF